MPKRVAKPFKFEVEAENGHLTPGQERHLWSVRPARRAPGELDEWRKADSDLKKFYASPRAAMAAYHLGDYALARQIAKEMLLLSDSFSDNWNHSNALHYGHTVLGLLAVKAGDVQTASAELLASAAVRGSPQLNSFGPSMRLARELLKLGVFEPVSQYLQLCRTFWEMGGRWLDIWEAKVARGAVPTFAMQCSR